MTRNPDEYSPTKGHTYLNEPSLNKGTAFTEAERDALGLRGLLPPHVFTMEEQVPRIMKAFQTKATDLEKFIYLTALHDRNETLFFRVVIDNLEMMMPIIYTPTVGKACQEYANIFRRPRGLFVSLKHRGQIRQVLSNCPHKNIRAIVVTDGERILGLGDLGANGMGIPVGKLALYTACAGVPPTQCLPVTLDVGTNNEALLEDPLYLGNNTRRIRGEEFDSFVDEFIQAARAEYPKAMIQFEDFGNTNAFRLLERYRDQICTFNDDIQGTASVAMAGIISALRITKSKLTDQTLVFQGAGEAGIGIAELITRTMVDNGLPEAEARRRCLFVDSKGLVQSKRTDLQEHKKYFAHDLDALPDLQSVVETYRPTAIIGVSGQPSTFTQPIVETMARLNERPIVFALSNPTSKAECTAEEAYRWSGGRAIFASGSPFDPVEMDGKRYVPGQGNNAYIFPGVALGVIACGSSRVTDEMFAAAAFELANQVTETDLESGLVYPPLGQVREVSAKIAAVVAQLAYDRGLATEPKPSNIEQAVRDYMYEPKYQDYA